jgi:uncharacterized protein YdcH (DUF465 family)
MQNELKFHPSYWKLHKKFWTEEYNNLDSEIARVVVNSPHGTEAMLMEKKVTSKIKDALMPSTRV